MKITSTSSRHWAIVWLGLVLVGVSTLGAMYFMQPVFAVISNESPNFGDVRSGGEVGGVSHLLKKETVADVPRLVVKAYYQQGAGASGADRVLQIRYNHLINPNPGKACLITPNIRSQGGNVFVRIIGEDTVRYRIPIANVCDDLRNSNGDVRTNVREDNDRSRNNKFFANYPFPQRMTYDEELGMYTVRIVIEYGNGVAIGASNENSVNFITRLAGPNSATAKIGPLSVGDGNASNQFGLRSAYFNSGTRAGVNVSTQFGIPCSEERESTFRVWLYDADAGFFGPTYLWVSENGRALEFDRYNWRLFNRVSTNETSFNNDGRRFRAIAGVGSGTNSRIEVNRASHGNVYRFHIRNPSNSSYANPANNVLSVGIPYDSIYADVDCSNDYRLRPEVSVNPATYSYYPSLTVRGWITNRGSDEAAGTHAWQLYAVRYSTTPESTSISKAPTTDGPCRVIPSRYRLGGCEVIGDGRYPNVSDRTWTYSNGGPDAPGTNVCFFVRVQNPTYQSANNAWRYSDMACAVSGIYPKIQVLSHDLRAGGYISTSRTLTNNRSYVSRGEYAIVANSLIASPASGNGWNVGGGSNIGDLPTRLTLANASTPHGFFGSPANFHFSTEGAESIDSINDVELTGSHVYYHEGTLTIDRNLSYDGSYRAISDLPRIVIVADNIEIQNNVTQIDPWLVSRGYLKTCSEVSGVDYRPDNLNTGICNNQLRFNGPVYADRIYLYRTYGSRAGSDATLSAPAEIFNLRPDAFLSTYSGSGTPIATTDRITELPPRF